MKTIINRITGKYNKTVTVRIEVTLRCVRTTVVTVEYSNILRECSEVCHPPCVWKD